MQHKDRQDKVPENVTILEYWGKILTNQNCMHQEMNSRLIWALHDTIRFGILFYSRFGI
jgi:hypothetical protein